MLLDLLVGFDVVIEERKETGDDVASKIFLQSLRQKNYRYKIGLTGRPLCEVRNVCHTVDL